MFTISLGCDFDPEQAMKSALNEAAGRHFGFEERTRIQQEKFKAALSDFRIIWTMEDHAALYGLPEAFHHVEFLISAGIERSVDEAYAGWREAVPKTLDLLDDIQYCLGLLASAGLNQVIVVDQTSPEQYRMGLCNVRVMAPGLMPLDFGYALSRGDSLSRLRSVPVKLGIQHDGNDINCVPHPFS
jgi:ribosomal protein S12 methylthiotransferase accessory factor